MDPGGKAYDYSQKAAEFLKHWGLEKEKIQSIYYDGTGCQNENAYYAGEQYVLKFSENLGKIKNHPALSNALAENGLNAATSIPALDGRDYIQEGALYTMLCRRLTGTQLKSREMYQGDFEKARFIGHIIGKMHAALLKTEAIVQENDLYSQIKN